MSLRNRSYRYIDEAKMRKYVGVRAKGVASLLFSTANDAKDAAAKINRFKRSYDASYRKSGDVWRVEVEGISIAELVSLIDKLDLKPLTQYH